MCDLKINYEIKEIEVNISFINYLINSRYFNN